MRDRPAVDAKVWTKIVHGVREPLDSPLRGARYKSGILPPESIRSEGFRPDPFPSFDL